jgi:phenylacetate-CoA ligase
VGWLSYNTRMAARYAFKRGPLFHRAMKRIAEFRSLASEAQQSAQLDLLEDTLAAAARAPYYAVHLERAGNFSNPVEKLKTLPYVDKESVRRHPRYFTAFRLGTVRAATSGTTGTPLRLRRDLACVAREEAGFFTWYQSAGWRPDDGMVIVRGDMVCPANRVAPPFGVYDSVGGRLVLSSYHMSDATLQWYCDEIRNSGYKFLSAYPSSAYVLADFIRRKGVPPLGLQAVFLASESVHDYQREAIEACLGRAWEHYGNAERTTWMTTCSAGVYHEDPSYGLTEYVPCGDGAYEIVATGFINRAMPLLRYRTGDIALEPFAWGQRCECGSGYPGCRAIVGRLDDLLTTPDGRRIGRLDHVFKGVRNVIAAQIVQHRPDAVTIRIVPAAHFSATDEEAIRQHFAQRAGRAIKLDFEFVDTLPRTAHGKFRAVISHCGPARVELQQ